MTRGYARTILYQEFRGLTECAVASAVAFTALACHNAKRFRLALAMNIAIMSQVTLMVHCFMVRKPRLGAVSCLPHHDQWVISPYNPTPHHASIPAAWVDHVHVSIFDHFPSKVHSFYAVRQLSTIHSDRLYCCFMIHCWLPVQTQYQMIFCPFPRALAANVSAPCTISYCPVL